MSLIMIAAKPNEAFSLCNQSRIISSHTQPSM